MLEIPLTPLPNQRFSAVLAGQNCVISLRQLGESLYASLMVDETVVFDNLLCNDRVMMPSFSTILFKGHLMLVDLLGREHPHYKYLGDRMVLIYLSEDEG